MAKRISVVVSQGQSQNPAKRNLEESIITSLMMETGIDVTVIPHLYDLKPDGTGILALKSTAGDLIVLSWLFERAAHWVLDRNGVHGKVGAVQLKNESDEQDEEDEEVAAEIEEDEKERVIDSRSIPDRSVFCLDLRVTNNADEFVKEIKRIQQQQSTDVVSIGLGGPAPAAPNSTTPDPAAPDPAAPDPAAPDPAAPDPAAPDPAALGRFENPTNSTALAKDGSGLETAGNNGASKNGAVVGEVKTENTDHLAANNGAAEAILKRVEEEASRRWYPVIDYSRCTNCMECIDFCLFGVYGVDQVDSILVEQPDNCRKGCPACSRVCPENAIMFPQHKTPAIAGSEEVGGSLKIDLSKLFGAPDEGKSAEEIAAIERDEQLLAVGREAVGLNASIPKRQAERKDEPKDDLDSLVDELDDLDL